MESVPVKEFDIFIPLFDNEGTRFKSVLYQNLQVRLLEYFNGLTFFPQPNEGFWRVGDATYRDEVVVYRVLTEKSRAARRYLSSLKEELKRIFRQEEILIVQRNVRTL
jgi:hypothetical protein